VLGRAGLGATDPNTRPKKRARKVGKDCLKKGGDCQGRGRGHPGERGQSRVAEKRKQSTEKKMRKNFPKKTNPWGKKGAPVKGGKKGGRPFIKQGEKLWNEKRVTVN